MWTPNQREIQNYNPPSLRDAGRQIAGVSGYVTEHTIKRRKVVGLAVTNGVFLGAALVLANDMNSVYSVGDVAMGLTTMLGFGIGGVKIEECVDNLCLERRAC